MKLLVDAGNSWIKCQLYEGEGAQQMSRFASAHYAVEMDTWFCGLTDIGQILVANVIGDTFELWFKQKCAEQGLPEPEFVFTPSEGLGVRVGYINPDQLGVDRYLSIAAAYNQVGGDVVVVDCGTAVTIDAVARGGVHKGGVIIPGLELMKSILGQKTAGIVDTHSEEIDVLARSTEIGVNSGTLFAVVGGVREVLYRQQARFDGEPHCLITGGAARIVADQLGLSCRVCHNLVIDGLLMLANK